MGNVIESQWVSSSPVAGERKRVLVIEDDQITYFATQILLQHYDWDVSHAGSVKEGIAALHSKPHHVLLDLGLPDGDGAKVLAHIREHNLPIAVTIVTGASAAEAGLRVGKHKTSGILRKPLNLLDLLIHLDPPPRK